MRISGYALLGLAIGLWLWLSPGTLFVSVFGIIIGYIICSNANNDEERVFLRRIFSWAMFLTLMFSCFNFYMAAITKNDSDLLNDASASSAHGAYIAEVLTNKKCDVETNYIDTEELNECHLRYNGKLPPYGAYRMDFISYLNGFVYAFFGYSPLIIKFFNSLIGIVGCFCIYFWIRTLFGAKEAKIAFFLVLFWPSRIIWAASGLKESLIFFAFSLSLFVFLKLLRGPGLFWACVVLFGVYLKYDLIYLVSIFIIASWFLKKWEFLGFVSGFIFMKLSFFLIYESRPYLMPLFMVTFIIIAFTFLKRFKALILIFSLAALFIFLHDRVDANFIKKQYQAMTCRVIIDHINKAQSSTRSRYYIYPPRFYNRDIPLAEISRIPAITLKELFISYVIGISYCFLYPFPWVLNSSLQLFSYIQMPLLYLLLPFILLGVIIGFRYYWRETLLYCLFIFLISSTIAMASGNGGTLFRHRDMVMPFFMAFAGIGLSKILKYPRVAKP